MANLHIHAEQLATALSLAIREQELAEARMGYNDESARLSTWKQILKALDSGDNLIIFKDTVN